MAFPLEIYPGSLLMRASLLCWIVLSFTLAGCGAHECQSKVDTDAKSSAKDVCPDAQCCSGPTSSAVVENEDATVALKTVKFDAFIKDVKAQNGKVVCAYLWSNASEPSKKNLPMLLELQRKYAKEGL